MKIAVFHNVPRGGAKRVIYEEAKYLSGNHEVNLFEYSSTDEDFLDIRGYCEDVNDYTFDINSEKTSAFNRLERDYQNFILLNNLSRKIAQDIDNSNFDVCLIHPDRYTQAPFVLRHLATPALYFCEEYLRIVYEPHLRFKDNVGLVKKSYEHITRVIRKKIDKDNAKSATLMVANSKFTQGKTNIAYGRMSEVCHPSVDSSILKKSKKTKKTHLLFIGGKDVINGYDLFKKAVKGLNSNTFKPSAIMVDLTKSSKPISDKKLSQYYSEAFLTICPSINEPFGMVPLESMACETPVLAVNEGGYKETIVDGKTGYLLPRDPKAFTEKVEYLIKHPKVAKKMGKEGRKHVKKNFTWEKHNKIIENMLLKLAKKN